MSHTLSSVSIWEEASCSWKKWETFHQTPGAQPIFLSYISFCFVKMETGNPIKVLLPTLISEGRSRHPPPPHNCPTPPQFQFFSSGEPVRIQQQSFTSLRFWNLGCVTFPEILTSSTGLPCLPLMSPFDLRLDTKLLPWALETSMWSTQLGISDKIKSVRALTLFFTFPCKEKTKNKREKNVFFEYFIKQ